MTHASAAATEVARRLWTDAAAGADTTRAMAAAAERLCAGLRAGLVRWIGSDGYQGLLQRALEQARPAHSWLGSLDCEGGRLQGIAAGVSGNDAAAVANGMLALIASLVHLLGRIAGEEMAVRLVEQAWAASARATPNADAATSAETTKGTRDG